MGIDEQAVRVAVIELVGYREWTESLGYDREWIIQRTQAELYRAAQLRASELGGFIIPIRYDYMLLLASNLSERDHRKILKTIKKYSPVEPKMASACSETPLAAEEAASNLLLQTKEGEVYYDRCSRREVAVIGHVDADDITGLTRSIGAYKAYMKVLEVLSYLRSGLSKWGAITEYLGGDNILTVLPPSDFHQALEQIKEVGELKLKIGVGVAPNFRKALILAAEALSDIRRFNSSFKVAVRIGNPPVKGEEAG